MFWIWEAIFGASILVAGSFIARRIQARRRMWERSIESKIAALEKAQRKEAA